MFSCASENFRESDYWRRDCLTERPGPGCIRLSGILCYCSLCSKGLSRANIVFPILFIHHRLIRSWPHKFPLALKFCGFVQATRKINHVELLELQTDLAICVDMDYDDLNKSSKIFRKSVLESKARCGIMNPAPIGLKKKA